jgi:hypothetical protein
MLRNGYNAATLRARTTVPAEHNSTPAGDAIAPEHAFQDFRMRAQQLVTAIS